MSFAPRLLCESVRTTTTVQDCGFGSEFGFSGRSPDGLTNTNAKVIIDKIGDATRTGLQPAISYYAISVPSPIKNPDQ